MRIILTMDENLQLRTDLEGEIPFPIAFGMLTTALQQLRISFALQTVKQQPKRPTKKKAKQRGMRRP